MRLCAIGGLPRSGSTLLCSVLAQNPRFYASSTSPVAALISQTSNFISNAPEVKSELANDRKNTERRIRKTLRGIIEGWYAGNAADVIFDKGRGWGHIGSLLFDLYPDARLVICVRDLREIFASIEKQHHKFPAFDDAANPNERTTYSRADRYFSPEGMIGFPIVGVEDLLRRRPKGLIVFQYETFVASPEDTLRKLYAELGEPWFDHDLESVESTATDLDALYLHKFPHEGSGAVADPGEQWQQYVSPDIATEIMNRYPGYNRAFGYT